jgi:glucokinase
MHHPAADTRIVLTLDAGGTKFVFAAVQGGREIVEPLSLPAHGDDLDACLGQVVRGFETQHERTGRRAVALSFAFPGPADYAAGIIGDLGNLPGFRGGVALGPMLAERFGLPVFVNNDGDLFALGESLGGLLPWVNERLAAAGSARRFSNLLGVTLGTGFGAGIVAGGRLVLGDNSAAAEIWLVRGKLDRDGPAEEGVSIRALRRAYAAATAATPDAVPDPKALAAMARGEQPGDAAAAREAFRRLGECAGDALANAVTLVDGLVAIGGGLAGAAPLFLPALIAELNGSFVDAAGRRLPRLESRAFDLDDPARLAAFVRGDARPIRVPGSTRRVDYDPLKRIGVGLSRLGTSRAIALGAYALALDALDALDR